MKPLRFKNFIPGIAWFFVVLILITLPGEDIPKPHGWFEWMNLIKIDKLVHTGIFGVLTFLFIYPFAMSPLSVKKKWTCFLVISILSSIWGLGTELIQKYFIPTRQFDLVDWAADSIGAAIALIISRKFFLRRTPKKEAQQELYQK